MGKKKFKTSQEFKGFSDMNPFYLKEFQTVQDQKKKIKYLSFDYGNLDEEELFVSDSEEEGKESKEGNEGK